MLSSFLYQEPRRPICGVFSVPAPSPGADARSAEVTGGSGGCSGQILTVSRGHPLPTAQCLKGPHPRFKQKLAVFFFFPFRRLSQGQEVGIIL